MAKKETFLGKEVRENKTSNWKVVEGSTTKLDKKSLNKVEQILVLEGEHGRFCKVILKGNKYVTFTLDALCRAEAGDTLKPESFRLHRLTNGEKEVQRAYGTVE